jgi:signal peptidase I
VRFPSVRAPNVPPETTRSTPPAPQPGPNVVAAARGTTAPRSLVGRVVDFVKGWTVPIVLFLFVRTFLLEAFRIPSPSMVPEMLVGDWLFVNKLAYGPHVPFTDVNLPGYDEPARGDIVVFVSPPQVDQPWDPTPTLVKRLQAVGGDTVFMRGGVLHVNGVAKPQRADESTDIVGANETHPLFAWQKPHEISGSRFGEPPAVPTHDDWGPLVVPPGMLFMLGDNRYQSKDSRYWGLVPRENVRGRPVFVYYSYNADDSDRALPFLTDIRWSRIGHLYK